MRQEAHIHFRHLKKKKKGPECLYSFFLELSGGNYLFCLFTLQIANGLLQPGLSPTLLCPAVTAVSLKENRFSGMLCVHMPVRPGRPHLPSR